MIRTCPHCTKDFNFSEAQQEKVEAALTTLKGGTLKLKCPRCFESVELNSDGSLADWRLAVTAAAKIKSGPEPPSPPDISWLTQGIFTEDERIKDIAKALVLVEPGELRVKIMGALVESFYQPAALDTEEDALTQLRMVQYDTVVLHSRFAGGKLRKSEVHAYMMRMPMAQRRHMFYILVGPEFHTLYSLEALANSANLVINDRDVDHFKNLYKRGKSDYDDLFGPYNMVLKEAGAL